MRGWGLNKANTSDPWQPKKNLPGERLCRAICFLDLYAADTFEDSFEGDPTTWHDPRHGTPHRLDYVAVPTPWRGRNTRAWSGAALETFNAASDHLPVCLGFMPPHACAPPP